jgi:hypothetical protein
VGGWVGCRVGRWVGWGASLLVVDVFVGVFFVTPVVDDATSRTFGDSLVRGLCSNRDPSHHHHYRHHHPQHRRHHGRSCRHAVAPSSLSAAALWPGRWRPEGGSSRCYRCRPSRRCCPSRQRQWQWHCRCRVHGHQGQQRAQGHRRKADRVQDHGAALLSHCERGLGEGAGR